VLADHEEQKPEEKPDEIREARVARSYPGSDHHNTLTPHWDFAFSV
jgi:hypothetical protein